MENVLEVVLHDDEKLFKVGAYFTNFPLSADRLVNGNAVLAISRNGHVVATCGVALRTVSILDKMEEKPCFAEFTGEFEAHRVWMVLNVDEFEVGDVILISSDDESFNYE